MIYTVKWIADEMHFRCTTRGLVFNGETQLLRWPEQINQNWLRNMHEARKPILCRQSAICPALSVQQIETDESKKNVLSRQSHSNGIQKWVIEEKKKKPKSIFVHSRFSRPIQIDDFVLFFVCGISKLRNWNTEQKQFLNLLVCSECMRFNYTRPDCVFQSVCWWGWHFMHIRNGTTI